MKVKNTYQLKPEIKIKMKLEILNDINQDILERMQHLMKQLCPDCPARDMSHYQDLIEHPTTLLLTARYEQVILGCLTLTWYPIPTGLKMWIEDVVVDENFHGQGIGKALIQYAIEIAKSKQATQLNLTSRPERIIANKLYQSLGFQLRTTNVYRMVLN